MRAGSVRRGSASAPRRSSSSNTPPCAAPCAPAPAELLPGDGRASPRAAPLRRPPAALGLGRAAIGLLCDAGFHVSREGLELGGLRGVDRAEATDGEVRARRRRSRVFRVGVRRRRTAPRSGVAEGTGRVGASRSLSAERNAVSAKWHRDPSADLVRERLDERAPRGGGGEGGEGGEDVSSFPPSPRAASASARLDARARGSP